MSAARHAPARVTRAISGVASPLIIGVAGHVLAGGRWSSMAVIVAALLMLGPSWLLCGREQRFWSIAPLLVIGQAVTHGSLSAFSSAGNAATTATGAAHVHHLVPAVAPSPAEPQTPGLSMTVFHVLAALIVGWWLRAGERRVWRAARRGIAAAKRGVAAARRYVGRWLRTTRHTFIEPSSGRPPLPYLATLLRTSALRHIIVLRGPPVSG